MKKIGIITIVKVNNYGSELQAFALQKKLNDLGFQAEIIDYLYYKHKDHKRTLRSKPWLPIGFKNKVKELLYPLYYSIKSLSNRQIKKRREQNFKDFHKSFTNFSKNYHSIDELYHAKMDYDIYMVGSDQVWNPRTYTNLDPYFLTFSPPGKKRISYASSFGVADIPTLSVPFYKERLDKFDSISVREDQAVALVKKISGKQATHVLDPTLLLSKSDWQKVSKAPDFDEKFILMYILSTSKFALELARFISNKTGWKIIRICKEAAIEDSNPEIINVVDAGPGEFLGWMINASFVITNSFHGTAFSVNFNKPFYTITNIHKSNNSRQQSLLRLLELENRIINEGDPMPDLKNINIDFSKTKLHLELERNKSVSFLINSINSN